MMNLNPFGRGDATNQSPTGDASSPEMGRIERGRGRNAPSSQSFPSKSRRRGSAEADEYKARCSDLERNIIQLKLELAEAKVSVRASGWGETCARSTSRRTFSESVRSAPYTFIGFLKMTALNEQYFEGTKDIFDW